MAMLAPFLIAIVAWWLYSQIIEPQPFYMSADPEIPYLMNSLSVFKGEPYTFIDHPGTPIEIIGSAILGMTYPFVGYIADSFPLAHILHPEYFLFIVRTLLVLMSMGTMALLVRYTVLGNHWTDGFAAVAVAVLFFTIHPKGFEYIINWSHNSFSFPVGTLLGLGIFYLVVNKKGGTSAQVVLLGFLLGVLTAVQIYFLTWVVAAIVAMATYNILSGQGWKRAVISSVLICVSSLGGFVVSTLPISNRYPEFVSWIIRVGAHQGRHGSGPPGFISLEIAVANFIFLWEELRLLFITIGLLIGVVVVIAIQQRRSIKTNAGLWAVAFGLIVQVGLMSALVIKHPGVIYMQAVAAALPLMLAVVFSLMHFSQPQMKSMPRLIKFGLSSVVFAIFTVAWIRSFILYDAETKNVQSAVEEIDVFLDDFSLDQALDRSSLTILRIYGMPSKCLALWYGNQYAGYTFSDEISSICPRDLYYNLWQNRVILADGSLVPLDQSNWDILVAYEAALKDFPYLAEVGEVVYSETQLGNFGRIVYVLPDLESSSD
ncbi:MAG: hypothetical protein BMS9Abin28_1013 [Anaerolineae bacterium]|nr:MAG: hypothetical protein BMS9Abin28_1013 [Anaerolineae bacterium]